MKRIVLILGFFSILNAQQIPQDSMHYLVQAQDNAQNIESTQIGRASCRERVSWTV